MFINYLTADRVAYITLNRPEKRNALNNAVVKELADAFSRAQQDDDAKVIVLQAEGDVFCAGADLQYLQTLQANTYQENLQDSTDLKNLLLSIYACPKVVIAQVQGHAIAGGSGLVSVCDFAFASSEANFGYTEVKIGFIPAIVMVFLIRKLGEQPARQLMLSGDIISAEKALQLGMLTQVVDQASLSATVAKFATKMVTSNSGESLAATKKMMLDISGMSVEEALSLAVERNAKTRETADCRHGIQSFLDKQKITW
jgi:methylglutaconyl-CoA hydratase